MSTLTISECFGPTIQGEGVLIGKPTVFVRTGGCDYECPPCDTLYAVLPQYKDLWKPMSTEHVFAEIRNLSLSPILVTLSGGNPAIQPLEDLIKRGHDWGDTFALETQGSVAKSWFTQLDFLTLSPKGPTMIGSRTLDWGKLDACFEVVSFTRHCVATLKIVVFDDADYDFAHTVADRYPAIPMYLQVGNINPPHVGIFDREAVLEKLAWLIKKVTQEEWNDVTVLPQLHTLLWGNKQGV